MKKETGKEESEKEESRETVLVTGATGFLGEYLVKRLTKRYRVLALGRNRERGQKLEEYGAVFCPGDFTDRGSCAGYFRGVQYVIHAGALSTVWGKWEDFYRTNVCGTDLVAQLCVENAVRRLVYLSSPSIYTKKEDQLGIHEDQAPKKNDLNYYIRSKLMAERRLRGWERKGLECVVLRPRGLIGIGDTSLVPRLLRANSKIGIPLFNGGHNLIDVTAVENVALACELAMTAPGAPGGAFNITNGEPKEFRLLLEQFLEAIGEPACYRELPFEVVYKIASGLERVYRTFRLPGEPPLTRYTVCTLGFAQTMDISRAREILGYQPEKTLEDSIREYGAWWKETHEKAPASERPKKFPERSEKKLPNPPGQIAQVRLYHCGSCTNNLGIIYRGRTWEKREFPAMAALIRHRKQGNILYDTGYSTEIFHGEIWLKIYRLLNPVHLKEGDTISEKLQRDGIPPESVKTIILSHAHPDHVGGLSQFSGYELVASEEVIAELRKPRLRNLTFRNLLPKDSKDSKDPKEGTICRMRPAGNPVRSHFLCAYFDTVYDLFGDGSLIGVKLDGHSRGQLGLWIPDFSLLLASDACWGNDLIRDTPRMRRIPRLIQNDFEAYQESLRRICLLKQDYPQIQVVFSHRKGSEKTYDS